MFLYQNLYKQGTNPAYIMAKETVEVLIEGGKATAAPPLGPALGPTGVNIGQVISDINKKTADFKGMQVPIKVIVDTDTKTFTITVGTPPASSLIKKEGKIDKGAANPLTDAVGDLRIEQVIKIAKMKEDSLLGSDMKAKVKEIVGTCNSMGVLVEGKKAKETLIDIDQGKFDAKIKAGKSELTEEELKELEAERKHLAEELEKNRKMYEAIGNRILKEMEGKDTREIRKRMEAEKIPMPIINELAPLAKAAPGGKPTPAPAKK